MTSLISNNKQCVLKQKEDMKEQKYDSWILYCLLPIIGGVIFLVIFILLLLSVAMLHLATVFGLCIYHSRWVPLGPYKLYTDLSLNFYFLLLHLWYKSVQHVFSSVADFLLPAHFFIYITVKILYVKRHFTAAHTWTIYISINTSDSSAPVISRKRGDKKDLLSRSHKKAWYSRPSSHI